MKRKKRNFNGMSYRELQRANSGNRLKLSKEQQKWLKENGYKNVGWEHTIKLYQAIENFRSDNRFEEMSLEELFLEADRIGNKYLTAEEIKENYHQLSEEAAVIGELMDKHFPDSEVEVIDYGKSKASRLNSKRNKKVYKTVKI